jgi:hypothetical protein
MNGLAKVLFVSVVIAGTAFAENNSVVEAVHASADVALTDDPAASFWSNVRPAYLEKDIQGKMVAGFRTEVRTRWTNDNLYFLFICPYEELYLKPSPNTQQETNQLWNWDVAEVFISSNFEDIKRYQEFEVSPQGEWIDLDIDLNKPHHEDGWTWNSGFEKKVRIDSTNKRWYAAMRIPLSAIDKRKAAAGHTFRMNLFLSEGAPANHHEVTWQPPMSNTFHVPEKFGLLKLIEKK